MNRTEFLAACTRSDREARNVHTPDGAHAGRVARTNVGYGKPWVATTNAPGGITAWATTKDFDTAAQAEAWLLARAAADADGLCHHTHGYYERGTSFPAAEARTRRQAR